MSRRCILFCLLIIFASYLAPSALEYEVEWTRTYNSPGNGKDYCSGIAVDTAGNVIVTGTEKRDDIGQSYNIWTRKYDSDGYEIWTSTYNSPSDGCDQATDVAVDSSGNVYVTGIEKGESYWINGDIWTRKYDPDGYAIWTSTYNSPANKSEIANAIAVDNAANIYITGYEYRDDIGQNYNIWTRKYDSDGYEIWTSTHNSPGNGADRSYGIAVDNSGNVYVTGNEERNDLMQNENIWTRKYDSNGYVIWTSTYNSPTDSWETGFAISVDSSGNVYVTGGEHVSGQSYNIWTAKYNTDGDEIWKSVYNSPANGIDECYCNTVDGSGHVYFSGYEERDDLGQGNNIITCKYDTNGYQVWLSTYNSPANSNDSSYAIAVDSIGNVYIAGGENRYDLGQGYNALIRKYKLLYNIHGTISDALGNPIRDIEVALSGNSSDVTLTDGDGHYKFGVTPGGNYSVAPVSSTHIFTPDSASYTNVLNDEVQDFTAESTTIENLLVFPNPHTGQTEYITFLGLTENRTLYIYDISGVEVFKESDFSTAYKWDMKNDSGEDVTSGVYIYRITNDIKELQVGKIAVIR